MKVPLGFVTRSGLLDPFQKVPKLGAQSKLTLACSLIASCIFSRHHDGNIILAFIVYHIHALHLHKSLRYHTSSFSTLLFCQLHTLYFHCSHVMFTHAWSWHIVAHALHFPKKKRIKRKSQWSMKILDAFLVAYIRYHEPTMLGS